MPGDCEVVFGDVDPRRRGPVGPTCDEHSAGVLDEATLSLTLLRAPMRVGDHLVELAVTASLLAECQARLPTAVDAAREQGHGWAEIAEAIGTSPTAARRRYQNTINER